MVNSLKDLYRKTFRIVVDLRDCYYLASVARSAIETSNPGTSGKLLLWQLALFDVSILCQLTESRLTQFLS